LGRGNLFHFPVKRAQSLFRFPVKAVSNPGIRLFRFPVNPVSFPGIAHRPVAGDRILSRQPLSHSDPGCDSLTVADGYRIIVPLAYEKTAALQSFTSPVDQQAG
jgi:hypothetical protein